MAPQSILDKTLHDSDLGSKNIFRYVKIINTGCQLSIAIYVETKYMYISAITRDLRSLAFSHARLRHTMGKTAQSSNPCTIHSSRIKDVRN